MHNTIIRILYSFILITNLTILTSSSEVIIARGQLCQEEDPFLRNQDILVPQTGVYYDVVEVGRGTLQTKSFTYQLPSNQPHTNVVRVSIYWETMTTPLPADAILILSKDGWERWPSYYIIAPVPWRTILPYTPEAWEKTMRKTDAELIGNPLPPEVALTVAEKSAIEKGVDVENIYLLRPGEDARRWVVNVFYLRPPYLYEYAVWLNARGNILNETMPLINRFYQPGEDLEAFMSREYAADSRGVPFRLQNHLATSSDTTP